MTQDLDPRLILLDERDNVVVVCRRLEAGSPVRVGGVTAMPASDVPLGHKLARAAIREGEKVLKYAAPIGRATRDISPGDHVHVHNMTSDYTPTYTLDAARRQHEGGQA